MSSLIKYSLSHIYRIFKVYVLLAIVGALAVVFVQATADLRLGLKDQEAVSFHIISEIVVLLLSFLGTVGTVPHLIEEIKSVLTSWRRVQAQLDLQIGHLADEIIPPEISPRLKS